MQRKAEGTHLLEDSRELRVAVGRQRLVQALSAEPGVGSDDSHTLGSRYVAECGGYECRIAFIKRCFEVSDDIVLGLKVVSRIPRFGSPDFDHQCIPWDTPSASRPKTTEDWSYGDRHQSRWRFRGGRLSREGLRHPANLGYHLGGATVPRNWRLSLVIGAQQPPTGAILERAPHDQSAAAAHHEDATDAQASAVVVHEDRTPFGSVGSIALPPMPTIAHRRVSIAWRSNQRRWNIRDPLTGACSS